jgi:hypothetical protein
MPARRVLAQTSLRPSMLAIRVGTAHLHRRIIVRTCGEYARESEARSGGSSETDVTALFVNEA